VQSRQNKNCVPLSFQNSGFVPHLKPIALLILSMAAIACSEAAEDRGSKSDASQTIQDFETRVSHYLDERKKRAGDSTNSMNSVEKLNRSQQTVAQKTKQTRQEAKQGDVFSPAIAAYFRRQILATLQGPQGPRIRASLRNAEPIRDVPLKVNQLYPQEVPLQSTPPTLLQNLPALPEELQYRIVGHTLLLLDVAPKLVVDFIPNALGPAKD
jgi:hypothetical protein